MALSFHKAVKTGTKLRLALIGPSGCGKTYTALKVATAMFPEGGRIALVDTEHGSASKYANLFAFDVLELDTFSPLTYVEAIRAAADAGYDVLILDSLSHAWVGKGGILEFVDTETLRSRSRNAYTEGWRKATPLHNELVDTMISASLHLIVTLRAKMAYVLETDEKGHQVPRKIGLQPVQREGLEYEFDVVADMDQDNTLVVSKSRCPELTGAVIQKPGQELASILTTWLSYAISSVKPAQPGPIEKARDYFAQRVTAMKGEHAPSTVAPQTAASISGLLALAMPDADRIPEFLAALFHYPVVESMSQAQAAVFLHFLTDGKPGQVLGPIAQKKLAELLAALPPAKATGEPTGEPTGEAVQGQLLTGVTA